MFQFLKEQFESATQKVQQSNIIEVITGTPRNQSTVDKEKEQNVFQTQLYLKYLRQKLINQLNFFQGKKVLVTDLGELFTMVLESRKVLQELGIEEIYYIDTDNLQVEVNQIIFFVRPDKSHMKRIVRIIRNNQIQFQQKNYLLIFSPRSTVVCKEYLEKEAVMGNLQIKNFNFDLIPINDEVLSLEMNDSIEHLYLRKELSLLQIVAESIQRMQVVFGKFHQIYGKGDFAKQVIEIVQYKEDETGGGSGQFSKMSKLIVIDRSIDFITPMCTPFTYEALIDEFYQIEQNCITIQPDDKNGLQNPKLMKLTKQYDQVYQPLKDLNIKNVIKLLEEKRNENKQILQQKNTQKSMTDMGDYLDKVKIVQREHNYILDHYIVSSKILSELDQILFNLTMTNEAHCLLQAKTKEIEDHIEDLIALQVPFEKMMRLMILYSQIQNGIKGKLYDFWRREIVHSYGIPSMIGLRNIEKVGLIKKKTEISNWDKIKQPLKLINENIEHENPQDFSYIYLAYAPISVRLVQELITQDSWKNILQTIRDLPGETVMHHQIQEDNLKKNEGCIVVYYIGGICYGEIAALRWLANKYNQEIKICTTNITSGNRIIRRLNKL